ncbi:TPA: TVP38/TMEM64 family protein [Vibrio parahaemolyticus]|uniref:TVP38/TMEM64 family protein n=1 Tax=Vibrio parahaemolyticus TaxID=670 RepID=UPI001C4F0D90|nr:TVP38/TMEM64 family protein [Vibrio parahaemolyticus]MDL2010125.1 TVP38/TMEM64 family protein [Vibrio parahaemolyticus]HCG6787913.1 TVP38/TMEM64 family protein [Vibrio parahaemolyticus]HCG6791175.1 TVP38/TMEM64 family protein [Vibrio parahaemolyticus]HCH3849489.1 TVP38/TMEM64 family protein [Vibrio parahaemolyticus]HCM1414777.1 TVP38/TMEM64 family protein [Vibrio parahaemolyticus]
MKFVKIALIVAVIALALFAAKQTGILELITDIKSLQDWIASFGVWGYAVFVAAFVFACVFLLPGSAFTIVAGIVFGPIKGGVLALFSATLGAVAAFIVARFLLRNTIMKKFGDNPIFKKIDDGVAANGTSFLILTRLVPVFPFSLQNYAYGLTSLNLGTYALVSLLTMAPGAFIFAYMAGDIATNGVSVMLLVKFAVAGLVLFGMSLIPKYIAKKKGINMEELAK